MSATIPHSPEAELAIIGSIYNDCGEADILHNIQSSGLRLDHFFEQRNKNLYTYAVDQAKEGGNIDMIQLMTYANSHPDKYGDASHISHLYSSAQPFVTLQSSIKILKDLHTRRQLYAHAQKTMSAASNLNSSLEETVTAQQAIIEAIQEDTAPVAEGVTLKIAMADLQQSWSEGVGTDGVRGVSLGLHKVDLEIGRAMPGDLVVFGGKPSTGKSVSLIQMAEAALSGGKRVLVFSLEMEAPQVGARMLSCASSVDYGSILRGIGITGACKQKMKRSALGFDSGSIKIYDKGDQTMDYIESISRIENDREKVDLIIVDYWQIIESHDHKEEIRRLEYTSRRLKQLAKITKAVVGTGSQLNEQDQPYGSKAILKDGNILLRIIASEETSGYVVEKSRNSARGQFIPCRLNGQYQRFE